MSGQHNVKDGDCILSIAEANGFFWETLWEHPENSGLKEMRKDPNTLMPGDSVFIPDIRYKEVERKTNQVHRFHKKGIPARFRLQIFDGYEYRIDEPYSLEIEGITYTGTTDKEGRIDIAVPPGAVTGKLYLGADKDEFDVRIGHLPPVNKLEGIKSRLNNLGFFYGEINNELNDETKAAIASFQGRFGLKVTGETDEQTEAKLIELHDNFSELDEAAMGDDYPD